MSCLPLTAFERDVYNNCFYSVAPIGALHRNFNVIALLWIVSFAAFAA